MGKKLRKIPAPYVAGPAIMSLRIASDFESAVRGSQVIYIEHHSLNKWSTAPTMSVPLFSLGTRDYF